MMDDGNPTLLVSLKTMELIRRLIINHRDVLRKAGHLTLRMPWTRPAAFFEYVVDHPMVFGGRILAPLRCVLPTQCVYPTRTTV